MKNITLLITVVLGLSTMAPVYAGGSMGGNPSCESGAVNVGAAHCGQKAKTGKSE